MKYRRLGRTGIEVSEVSLGTWQVGGGWGTPFDENKASKIIETALEHGVNFLDTADVYDAQLSEKIVGKYIRSHRSKLFIATKIGRRIDPHVAAGYTPKAMDHYVNEALKNTGLEYLDLVQLHCPPTEVYYNKELFQKLEAIKSSGKVRHFGVSVEKVSEAIQASTYEVIETVQIIFNMFRQKPIKECFPILKERDLGIIVRVPLASGLLSGKMSLDQQFHEQDHRHFNRNGEVFDKGETFSGVPLTVGLEVVEALKSGLNTHALYEEALKWILSFDEVGTVIPGASTPEQVVFNTAVSGRSQMNHSEKKLVLDLYEAKIAEHVEHLW